MTAEKKRREVFIGGEELAYFSRIIEAIKGVAVGKVWYGEYYIDRIKIGFDGEHSEFEIGIDHEHDKMSLILVNPHVREADPE